jgi:phosphatidylserine synthase
MADMAERRERGSSLMFIGLAVWVADLLVVFFLPAGIKAGMHTAFTAIIAVLAVLGLVLMVAGYRMRGGESESS